MIPVKAAELPAGGVLSANRPAQSSPPPAGRRRWRPAQRYRPARRSSGRPPGRRPRARVRSQVVVRADACRGDSHVPRWCASVVSLQGVHATGTVSVAVPRPSGGDQQGSPVGEAARPRDPPLGSRTRDDGVPVCSGTCIPQIRYVAGRHSARRALRVPRSAVNTTRTDYSSSGSSRRASQVASRSTGVSNSGKVSVNSWSRSATHARVTSSSPRRRSSSSIPRSV